MHAYIKDKNPVPPPLFTRLPAQACITGGKAARAAPRPKIMVMTLSWRMARMIFSQIMEIS
jgi:hypothetical protein